jgi:hypothetical protein
MLILRYECMCPGQPRIAKKFVDDRHLRWKRRGGLTPKSYTQNMNIILVHPKTSETENGSWERKVTN